MGFRKFVKKRGIKVGNYVTFSKHGTVNITRLNNIEKYKCIEVYIDDETMEIALLPLERERLKFEQDSFAILKQGKAYYIDMLSVFKDLNIKLSGKVEMPFRLTDDKMYVFNFSQYKQA